MCLAEFKGFAQLCLCRRVRIRNFVFPALVTAFSPRAFLGFCGRDPFSQTFRKFRSKTKWIGSVQPEKFRKNGSTFWGGPLFPVGPVGISVEWIAPCVFKLRRVLVRKVPTFSQETRCRVTGNRWDFVWEIINKVLSWVLRSENAKNHYCYFFFYKINKGDLPGMYSCAFWCEFIDLVGFLAVIVWPF